MACPSKNPYQKAFSRTTLKKRFDFLKVAQEGRKAVMPSLILQFSSKKESVEPRFGFTATRKIGSSVVRNRARRRLRAVIDSTLKDTCLNPGDYVLVARSQTSLVSFHVLMNDFKKALTYAA